MKRRIHPVLPAALLFAAASGCAQAQVQRFVLPNGLRVLLREDQGRLAFRARLRLDLRPGDVPPGLEGLIPLTLRMLDRGSAGHLDPAEFDRALDDGGIQLSRHVSPEALVWDLASRGRDQDRALALLGDRVMRPILDPGTLEAERLACWRSQEASLATSEARVRAALGLEGSPAGTESSLGRITFPDILGLLQRVFRPDRALLVLEGDLGLEQAKALALLSLGTWAAGPQPPEAAAASAPAAPPPGPARIPEPGASLRIEAAAPPPADQDRALGDLLRILLPNDPALAGLLRPEAPRGTLHFVARPALATGAEGALAALRGQIAALARRGFTESDLDRARTAWTEARRVRLLHPDALLEEALDQAEGRAATPEAVAAATSAALNAALARWLDPARLRWAVVGDPKALATP